MNLTIERYSLREIDSALISELKSLYEQAYHASHMLESLLEDISVNPSVFQLFAARQDGEVVGARVIESKNFRGINHLGYRPIYGKRFTVLPEKRGQGLGKEIITYSNNYCWQTLNIEVLFGASGEFGALKMYGENGALYLLDSIKHFSHRNRAEDNIRYVQEFFTNPIFREFRTPGSKDIHFAYPRTEQTKHHLLDNGYITKAQLSDL